MTRSLIMVVATGCYVGLARKAPGTWGSLAALVPWYFCRELPLAAYLAVVVALFVTGALAAGAAEKILDQADAGCIVIDEILGMFVTLALAPAHPIAWALGFVLFRFFDILKPFPVSWFDKTIHGGFGVMLDDVAAGLYALVSLQVGWHLLTVQLALITP